MSYKEFSRGVTSLASTRILQFLSGLIRVKLISFFLGLRGTGVLDQINFTTQRVSQFTLLSISEALVKQISANSLNSELEAIINRALKAYIFVMTAFSLLNLTVLTVFYDTINNHLFGEDSYSNYLIIIILSFPILITDSIPFSILKAFKDFKAISLARVVSVIINLVLLVPLVYYFRLRGAIIYVPLSFVTSLIVNMYFARKSYFKLYRISLKNIVRSKVNLVDLKEMLSFSMFGLIVGTSTILSELICRSIVIRLLGVESLGLYSSVLTFSSIATGFILPAFSTYLYPKFCELSSSLDITILLNQGLRLGTFAMLPLLLLGIPLRELLITTVYTTDFIGAAMYLPFHFMGVLFYVWWYVFTQVMTPQGRIFHHGVFMVLYLSLDIIVTYVFVGKLGLSGWMLKHIISPIVFFLIYYFYVRNVFHFRLSSKNLRLMSYSLTTSLMVYFIGEYSHTSSFVLIPLFIIGIWTCLNEDEKILIRKYTF